MSTMVDFSSELKLAGLCKNYLRKTFIDIESDFDSIEKSISNRQDQLVSLEISLRNQFEEIKLREKHAESVEESVNLRFKELESREANEKLLFEKREKELELTRLSVEERSKELDDVRVVIEQGLKRLDLKEKQFKLLEKSVDEKSKELEFVQNSIQHSFKELEEKQSVKNRRGKRPLADSDDDCGTERLTKQQRHDNVFYLPSTAHAEADNRAIKGVDMALTLPDTRRDMSRLTCTMLRDIELRDAGLKLQVLIEIIKEKICDEIEPSHSRSAVKIAMDRTYRFIKQVIVFENKIIAEEALKKKNLNQKLEELKQWVRNKQDEYNKEKSRAEDKAYKNATRQAALRFDVLEKQAFRTGWINALYASNVDRKSQLFINIPVYDSERRELTS